MCWGPTLGFMEPKASESLKIKQTYAKMNKESHCGKEKNGVGGHTENDGDLLSTAVIQGGLPEEGTIRLAQEGGAGVGQAEREGSKHSW